MTAKQKNMILGFAFAVLIAVLNTSTKLFNAIYLHDLNTLIYAGVVIAWGFLVQQRIVNRLARRHLVGASFFMLGLFLSRIIRWKCFRHNAFIKEIFWYFYYVSFMSVPLCAFLAALCVGKTQREDPLRRAKWLWLIQGGFSALLFTNPWHELFFHFHDETLDTCDYGILFYACFVWMAILTVSAMIVIIQRCQIAALRKYWFIPILGMLFFAGLIVWYYAIGGTSPKLFNLKLYEIQEVFCLLFIFPFESMIQLGIMPNNSRYALFFKDSPISSSIQDEAGNIVYASKAQVPSENERRSEKAIHGGKMVWYEDLTGIQKLNEELQEVTEELEEENELIREENRIRGERISYETKNRLYDKIAGAVKEKALTIDNILTEIVNENAESAVMAQNTGENVGPAIMAQNTGENTGSATMQGLGENADTMSAKVKEKLIRAMLLGAYVKRRGNMMLLTEESTQISTKELGSAIRESLDYFSLTKILNNFKEYGERRLPAKLILLAQDLWQEILECFLEMESLYVVLDAREGFLLRIMMEAEELPLDETWQEKELAALGARLLIEHDEDEAWRVDLLVDENRCRVINEGADGIEDMDDIDVDLSARREGEA